MILCIFSKINITFECKKKPETQKLKVFGPTLAKFNNLNIYFLDCETLFTFLFNTNKHVILHTIFYIH